MRNVANNIREDIIEDINVEKENSYIVIWQVYLINQIIEKTNAGEYQLFQASKEYKTLLNLLQLLYSGEKRKIVPKLTKGYAKVNASLVNGIDAEISMEIEFNKETGKVNFNKTARLILELFLKLCYIETPVYVLIDELELSVKNKKEFTRDIELVRDLIIAVDRMNHIAREKGYNIKIIASIR